MNMKPVKSSNIVSAGYDPQAKQVIVDFKGGSSYVYEGVPPDVYENFEKTFQEDASSGRYLNQNIKQYPFKKVTK